MGRSQWPTADRRLAPWLAEAPPPGSDWARKPPPVFPPRHAVVYGEDVFGLWYAFEYGGVRQRMRWIPPGEFLMGSPEHEAEHRDNETQHPVTLTNGYWLADTACTQALW